MCSLVCIHLKSNLCAVCMQKVSEAHFAPVHKTLRQFADNESLRHSDIPTSLTEIRVTTGYISSGNNCQ